MMAQLKSNCNRECLSALWQERDHQMKFGAHDGFLMFPDLWSSLLFSSSTSGNQIEILIPIMDLLSVRREHLRRC